jgi:ABC-type branched-subunit amino acid transport system ATPase component
MVADPPAFELRHAFKRFGGVVALDDITLAVAAGTSVGLVGPNGCGKTTLFNVLSGFIILDQGTIFLKGRLFRRHAPHLLARAGVGRTFQEGRVWSDMTVSENIIVALRDGGHSWITGRTPSRREKNKIEDLIRSVGLDPRQSQTLAGTLSLNDRRRVELARALSLNPSILLVDEIAAGLNPVESADLLNLIACIGRQRGLAVVIVEHKLDILFEVCDRILIIDEGRIHADGSPRTILSTPEELRPCLGGLLPTAAAHRMAPTPLP